LAAGGVTVEGAKQAASKEKTGEERNGTTDQRSGTTGAKAIESVFSQLITVT
jgi:hypothetical protein